MAARSTVTSKGKIDFQDNLKRLLRLRTMVGIPADGKAREPEPGEKSAPNNAMIGYVQEFGDDEKRIPARPFLIPGVRSVQTQVVDELRKAGEDAFDRDFGSVRAHFVKVGTVAVSAARRAITDGQFAPLSQRTIEARAARGRKGAKQYLKLQAQGTPREVLDDLGDNALIRPLVDTGQLRRALTYVVKDGND